MLIPWASQQRGGSPAPPDPVVVSDFENSVYEINGVSKVIADLWAALPAGLAEVAGEGLVCDQGGTYTSATLTATADVYAAVNPQLGFSGVLSVDVVDGGQGGIIAIGGVYPQGASPYNTVSAFVATPFAGNPDTGSYLFVRPPDSGIVHQYPDTANGPHKIAYSVSATECKMSLDGRAVITVTGMGSTAFATLAHLQIYFEKYLGITAVAKAMNFYSEYLSDAQLQTLST